MHFSRIFNEPASVLEKSNSSNTKTEMSEREDKLAKQGYKVKKEERYASSLEEAQSSSYICLKVRARTPDYLKIALRSRRQIDLGILPARCGPRGIPDVLIRATECYLKATNRPTKHL